MKCCIGFFVAFAIADCFIDEDAQRCRNTYFHIDMQVQLCRGPQNQSMCRCSCVQISISQRGRTEETAHAFQSTEHLVHLFLSLHLNFLKNVNFRKLNILFPFAELLLSQPNTFPFSSFQIQDIYKKLTYQQRNNKKQKLGHCAQFFIYTEEV